MSTPQIIIFLDENNQVHVEAPGKNGSRRKLDLTLPQEMIWELQEQKTQIRNEEERKLLKQKKQNISYVTATHQQLAEKVWGKDFVRENFSRRYQKHITGTVGNVGSRRQKSNLPDSLEYKDLI